MTIIRVNKNNNYTVMSNYHFKDKRLSLKAKGLLSQMLSLPDNWDYSIAGLVAINKENETAIKTALDELKDCCYLKVTKMMANETKSGRIEYIYDIYEYPLLDIEKQDIEILGVENLGVEILGVENQGQLNIYNKINNNKINNNKKENIKRKNFIKPTIEEIKEYCKERNNGIDAERFYDFYESKDWMIGKNKMKDWKACIRTWEKGNKSKEEKLPDWWNKTNEDFEKEISNEIREKAKAIRNGTYRT